jgi:hypothetical protein
MESNQIVMNQAVIDALLDKDKYVAEPTGFAPGMTITYGALTPEYLAQRLGRPDPSQYPLGTNDPTFTKAMTDWTRSHGTDFAAPSPDQMAMIDQAFAAWQKVLNVTFVPVASDSAQIRIGTGDLSAAVDILKGTAPGYELRSHTGNALTDYNIVVINKRLDPTNDGQGWRPSTQGFEVLLHEIGHALGLEHPGDNEIAMAPEDNNLDTLMSYLPINYVQSSDDYGSLLVQPPGNWITPARYDIAALQTRLGTRSDTVGNGNSSFSHGNTASRIPSARRSLTRVGAVTPSMPVRSPKASRSIWPLAPRARSADRAAMSSLLSVRSSKTPSAAAATTSSSATMPTTSSPGAAATTPSKAAPASTPTSSAKAPTPSSTATAASSSAAGQKPSAARPTMRRNSSAAWNRGAAPPGKTSNKATSPTACSRTKTKRG